MAAARAEYCHILLTADVEAAIARFTERTAADDSAHAIVIGKFVWEHGGADFLQKIYCQLTESRRAGGRRTPGHTSQGTLAGVAMPWRFMPCRRCLPE